MPGPTQSPGGLTYVVQPASALHDDAVRSLSVLWRLPFVCACVAMLICTLSALFCAFQSNASQVSSIMLECDVEMQPRTQEPYADQSCLQSSARLLHHDRIETEHPGSDEEQKYSEESKLWSTRKDLDSDEEYQVPVACLSSLADSASVCSFLKAHLHLPTRARQFIPSQTLTVQLLSGNTYRRDEGGGTAVPISGRCPA